MNTWIELSKHALKNNISQIKSLLNLDTKLIAVVKANAYGHGLTQVSEVIQSEVDYLAVIREKGVNTPIIILGYINESADELQWLMQERAEVVVNSLSHAQRLSKIISESGAGGDLRIHIKIDTGMGRMGIMPQNAVDYIKKINELPHLLIKGVESHFSDVVNHRDYAKKQLQTFEDIRFQLYKEKIEPQMFHMAKTEAILDFSESHLDAVRLGIGLYGLWPDQKLIDRVKSTHPEFELKPVLTWKTKVLQVKDYPEGEYIGYGCTHKTKRKTKIAIIPVGYYEGYSRGLSNKAEVLINGKRCPIIGRVCMNMSMVDVTDVYDVKRGVEVVLIGKQGENEITADELAEIQGAINYEVVTGINSNIERIITK
jgi:alanine racemase